MNFIEFLKVAFIKMIAILIILVKLANSRPPWNNYFLKKRLTYHNFCPRHHQTKVIYLSQIILHMWSCDKTSVILLYLWFYKDLTKERDFFQGWFWFNLTKLGLVLGMIYWKLERFLRKPKKVLLYDPQKDRLKDLWMGLKDLTLIWVSFSGFFKVCVYVCVWGGGGGSLNYPLN